MNAATPAQIRRAIRDDHCAGIVTRDGIQEPCEKPTTCIINDQEDDQEDGWPWAACVWHAHRYGTGRMVPLSDIRAALEETS